MEPDNGLTVMHFYLQAMALMALPSNAPTALKNLTRMVDDMWYYAGDRSTYVNITAFLFNTCAPVCCKYVNIRAGEWLSYCNNAHIKLKLTIKSPKLLQLQT